MKYFISIDKIKIKVHKTRFSVQLIMMIPIFSPKNYFNTESGINSTSIYQFKRINLKKSNF